MNTFFNDRITIGAGVGPYVYLDHKQPRQTGKNLPAAVAPMASLTYSVRLSESWNLRLIFDRVASNYNRDSDIFLVGLGYHWPR